MKIEEGTKLLFLDTETTGVHRDLCGITQIGAIYVRWPNEVAEINLKCKPNDEDLISPGALEITQVDYSELMSRKPAKTVCHEFQRWLGKHVDQYDKADKMLLVGKNVNFDHDFLRNWFTKCGEKYLGSFIWSSPNVDITTLAALHLAPQRASMENFKLITIAKAMGIMFDESKAHDAMFDVILTLEIFKRCVDG